MSKMNVSKIVVTIAVFFLISSIFPVILANEQNPAALPEQYVLLGDTAIDLELFFSNPEMAAAKLAEVMTKPAFGQTDILIYLTDAPIDAFTSKVATQAQRTKLEEQLTFIVDAEGKESSFELEVIDIF